MINQIQAKILNDNGEALETQAGTLSVEEKTRLSNLVTKDPAIEMAKNSKIKIKDKDGVEFSATAEQILFGIGKMLRLANGTNYQEYIKNNKITVDGHVVDNSQFSGRWSELMAYLQLAAGKGLSTDGKFWANTAKGFVEFYEELNNNTNANTPNTPNNNVESDSEIAFDITAIRTEPFYDDFLNLFTTEEADKYVQTYNVFDARTWMLNRCSLNMPKTELSISYTSQITGFDTSIVIKIEDIQKPNLLIDKDKLMKEIKRSVEEKEKELEKEALIKSIEEGVKTVPINKLWYAQYDYVKENGWYNRNNNMLLFYDENNHVVNMVVEDEKLVIKYGNTEVKLDIANISKDNKFDQALFIVELQKQSLTNSAKLWIEGRMTTYASNGENFLLTNVPVSSPHFATKMKKMKEWLEETKDFMKTVENTYRLPTNPEQKEKFKKQIAVIDAKIWLDNYYRIYKNYTTTTHTPEEMNRTEEEFKRTMSNVLTKKAAFEAYEVWSFDRYMNDTYRTIYPILDYTE